MVNVTDSKITEVYDLGTTAVVLDIEIAGVALEPDPEVEVEPVPNIDLPVVSTI